MSLQEEAPAAGAALWRVGWRYLAARRWQSLLMVLGIALGVAVVVSIDLANASASRGFSLSTESVTGKTTHQIEGGSNGVDEAVYVGLRRENIVDFAAPIVSDYVTSPQLGERPFQLLGIDPFSDAPFRSYIGQVGDTNIPGLGAFAAFFTQPGAVMISRPVAERYNLLPGNVVTLVVGGYRRDALIVGLLTPSDGISQRTLDGLILSDISTAQELTNSEGILSRIDIILPEDDPSAATTLEEWLPPGYRLVAAAAKSGTIQQMAAVFQLNLTALSLLALVVGLFLIYNTMTFSVVQRRSLFGTLRCLGVTRREVFLMVIGEALLVGLVGGLLGIGLGMVLGQITIRMVTQTVNDLYFTTTVQSIGFSPQSLIKGGLLGLVATVFTAALPAWEAASVPPRAALLRSGIETKTRQSIGKVTGGGIFLALMGLALFVIPTTNVIIGFAGTLFVVVGCAFLSSTFFVLFMRGAVPFTARVFGMIGRMAPRNLVNALSRTAVAVAALMIAVAVIIGVALMIDSFRYTVIIWLEQTLQGDIYVSVPGYNATRATASIDPQVVRAVQNWPGVGRVDTLRSIQIDSEAGMINLAATENPQLGEERQFAALDGTPEGVWDRMNSGEVLISEPLANRMRLKAPGSEVRLFTPQGWKSFRVIGIYYDYASSEGTVMMALSVYRQLWQDDMLTALALRLDPEINADLLAVDLQDHLPSQQELLIRPNAALRQDVLEVFDRTFAITVALRMLATLVAFAGVFNALLLIQLERQREVGILRALGLTGGQLWRLVMVETGLMGLAAGLFSIPTGYALALILVYVINQRSFGWTLQLAVNPLTFIQAFTVALGAALLAGIYPAWKMSRMPAAEVIRYE